MEAGGKPGYQLLSFLPACTGFNKELMPVIILPPNLEALLFVQFFRLLGILSLIEVGGIDDTTLV